MADDSNQHDDERKESYAPPPLPRLPLHPRKAQELFFELLQIPTSGSQAQETDSRTQSLQQRIAGMQTEYEAALKMLKRGIWVRTTCSSIQEPTDDSLLVQLRLSSDGEKLQLSQLVGTKAGAVDLDDGDDAIELELLEEVAVVSIDAVEILSASGFFSLHTCATGASSLFDLLFEVESESVLKQCGIAISGTLHALKTRAGSGSKTEQLLWQAIRLRIVELTASTESLHDAISTLEAAYRTIQERETQIDLPDPHELFVLRSG